MGGGRFGTQRPPRKATFRGTRPLTPGPFGPPLYLARFKNAVRLLSVRILSSPSFLTHAGPDGPALPFILELSYVLPEGEILGQPEGNRPRGCRDCSCSARFAHLVWHSVNAGSRETAEGWRLAKFSELGEFSSGPGLRRSARRHNGSAFLIFRRTRPRQHTRWRQNRVGGYKVQTGSRGRPGARRNVPPD